MKIFFLVISLSFLATSCSNISTEAQIRANANGVVANLKPNRTTPDESTKTLDLSTVDFKNFIFPDFNGKAEKTITLKNGTAESKGGYPKYTLRRTYYFDLTGDRHNESVSHIIADGCELGCESNNLFYIHTADNNQPKLLWKIATGGDVLGGLKTVNFKAKEIILESFGDCSVENSVIKPRVDLKRNTSLKTQNYTRFVFSLGEAGFAESSRDLLPVPAGTNIAEHRPKISFGDQQ